GLLGRLAGLGVGLGGLRRAFGRGSDFVRAFGRLIGRFALVRRLGLLSRSFLRGSFSRRFLGSGFNRRFLGGGFRGRLVRGGLLAYLLGHGFRFCGRLGGRSLDLVG